MKQHELEDWIIIIVLPIIVGTVCAFVTGTVWTREHKKYIECKAELSEVKQNKLDEINKAANSCRR